MGHAGGEPRGVQRATLARVRYRVALPVQTRWPGLSLEAGPSTSRAPRSSRRRWRTLDSAAGAPPSAFQAVRATLSKSAPIAQSRGLALPLEACQAPAVPRARAAAAGELPTPQPWRTPSASLAVRATRRGSAPIAQLSSQASL